MSDVMKWVLGVGFSLILGSFGYTARVDSQAEVRTARTETRVVERLDRLESKVDRLLERR